MASAGNSTTIVVVFVSFIGCVSILAFLYFVVCCFFLKKKAAVKETEVKNVDEHFKVKGTAIGGPHGPEAVVMKVDDDVQVHETTFKNAKVGLGSNISGPLPASSSQFPARVEHMA
ncbi:hypothetical protein RJ641_029526 [Dillenia turbinata]|uniref:Uncharacterized protein n=1 Tax=Dillenia turbinata TaxID=194707 RepID=A0AAN8VTK2_9MAGN